MRVRPCQGVEYVLIVQSMSHMPGLPIQTEGLNLHKSIYIEAYCNVFTFIMIIIIIFVFLCHQFQYSAIQISRHFHTSKLQINLTKIFLYVVVLLRQLLTVWSAMIILLKTWPRRSAVTASKKTADMFFFFPFMQKFNELPCHFHKNSTSK